MKENIFQIILIILLAALVAGVYLRPNEGGQYQIIQSDTEDARTITINSTGKTELVPDMALITIGFQSKGKDVKEISDKNNEEMKNISDAVIALGVKKDDITTSDYSIYSNYYDRNGNIIDPEFTVRNTLRIKVRDLGILSKVLTASVDAGANEINGISFDSSERESAYNDALKAAIAAARDKANVMAKEMGVEVKEILKVSEASYSVSEYKGVYDAVAMEESSVPVFEGTMSVTATINVVFGY